VDRKVRRPFSCSEREMEMSLVTLLFLAAQAAAPSPAVSDQLGFDVQCMIASQTASEQAEGAAKAGLTLATMFYFGRVDSILSGDALMLRMEQEAKALQGKPLAGLMQQCGQFMTTRGKALQDVGTKLEQREQTRQLR
jgi:hypothetical protein